MAAHTHRRHQVGEGDLLHAGQTPGTRGQDGRAGAVSKQRVDGAGLGQPVGVGIAAEDSADTDGHASAAAGDGIDGPDSACTRNAKRPFRGHALEPLTGIHYRTIHPYSPGKAELKALTKLVRYCAVKRAVGQLGRYTLKFSARLAPGAAGAH